ncbi:hypothetical protein OsJ_17562 [Oryza sativa Japonica Group]|uniref:Uncharacterized protein n=1 Tax=Oryza sativa subsp. japonica TaxID=39947 RepID=B9FN49_ORYSJ|nr:hypothetical protein OsJ_17562 [Oryza sativa Japonica Group]
MEVPRQRAEVGWRRHTGTPRTVVEIEVGWMEMPRWRVDAPRQDRGMKAPRQHTALALAPGGTMEVEARGEGSRGLDWQAGCVGNGSMGKHDQ